MKITALFLLVSVSFTASAQAPHDYRYAAQMTNYREDIWQEFLYIKSHHGQLPKEEKISSARFYALRDSIPNEAEYLPEAIEMLHVALCERDLDEAIYYFAAHLGSDPTHEIEECRFPATDARSAGGKN